MFAWELCYRYCSPATGARHPCESASATHGEPVQWAAKCMNDIARVSNAIFQNRINKLAAHTSKGSLGVVANSAPDSAPQSTLTAWVLCWQCAISHCLGRIGDWMNAVYIMNTVIGWTLWYYKSFHNWTVSVNTRLKLIEGAFTLPGSEQWGREQRTERRALIAVCVGSPPQAPASLAPASGASSAAPAFCPLWLTQHSGVIV